MLKKLTFFFDVFPVKRGAGQAAWRHGTARTPTNFQFFGLAPGGTIVPSRTHGTATETEIDFPVGHTPQPPINCVFSTGGVSPHLARRPFRHALIIILCYISIAVVLNILVLLQISSLFCEFSAAILLYLIATISQKRHITSII
jgi:hypothetical protein